MRGYLERSGWNIKDDDAYNCSNCDAYISNCNYCSSCGEKNELSSHCKGSEELWQAYLIGKKADK